MSTDFNLKQDLIEFLGEEEAEEVLAKDAPFIPAAEFANVVADSTQTTSELTLNQMRHDFNSRFSSGRIGSLMGTRILNRNEQQRTLSAMGPDVILDLVKEGMSFPAVSKQLGVSYGVLVEFMERMSNALEITKAESLSVDMMVDDALQNLTNAGVDREEVARNKALLETTLKIAKAKSKNWVEQKPSTLIQNNYGADGQPVSGDGGEEEIIHGFQMVLTEGELPPLPPIRRPASPTPVDVSKEDPLMPDGELRFGGYLEQFEDDDEDD